MKEIEALLERSARYLKSADLLMNDRDHESSVSKEMGRELNRAFAKRQIGDYTHAFAISGEEALQLLEAGRYFVAKVEEYLQENQRL